MASKNFLLKSWRGKNHSDNKVFAKSDCNGPKFVCCTILERYAFSLVVLECNVFTLKGFFDLITPLKW